MKAGDFYAISISKRIVEFCRESGLDERRCMAAGLCAEEMAGSIVRHGVQDVRRHMIDIRISYKSGGVTIRLRDNCRAFAPSFFPGASNPMIPWPTSAYA